MNRAAELRRFLRFLFVGAVGFLVDFGLLSLGLEFGLGPIISRFISAIVAISVTWWLNRQLTFAVVVRPSWREWRRYYLVSGTGFGINFGIYLLAISLIQCSPQLSLIFGSAVALIWNFILNRMWVFAPVKEA